MKFKALDFEFDRLRIAMPDYIKRYYGRGDLHFMTFSCYSRAPFLESPRARDTFVSSLAKIRERYKFLLVGYVVMPEHVHLLMGETSTCTPSLVSQVLKQRVARALKSEMHPSSQFWEDRFYDFNVYSVRKRREKLQYMHANPIKRGLVGDPADWPWSSFLSYAKVGAGLIPIDYVN